MKYEKKVTGLEETMEKVEEMVMAESEESMETAKEEEKGESEGNNQDREVSECPGVWKDNRGVGVIEIVLILVILIGLVLVFKEQITQIVNNAFASISGDAGEILK